MDIINGYLSGTLVPIALLIYSILFFVKLRGRPMMNPIIIVKSLFLTVIETVLVGYLKYDRN